MPRGGFTSGLRVCKVDVWAGISRQFDMGGWLLKQWQTLSDAIGWRWGLIIAAGFTLPGYVHSWTTKHSMTAFPDVDWALLGAIASLIIVLVLVLIYATKLRENAEEPSELLTKVSRLLTYPDAARDIAEIPTLTEQLLKDRRPRRLFDYLMNATEKEIRQVQGIGSMLSNFRSSYYGSRQLVVKSEGDLMTRIGEMVSVRFSAGWRIYLQYAIFRFAGMTREEIEKGDHFLNYSITWDGAEKTFTSLSANEEVVAQVKQILKSHEEYVADVDAIRMKL
jgi:hypothetical protein